jgi:signal transduction histidine kinase
VKFTPPDGRVSIECESVPNGMMSIRVTDTGRGIESSQIERVFQPFVQVDAGLTRTQDGVGLGLAISRDLARGMGGDLTVTSEPGVGSTFTLTVPVTMPVTMPVTVPVAVPVAEPVGADALQR